MGSLATAALPVLLSKAVSGGKPKIIAAPKQPVSTPVIQNDTVQVEETTPSPETVSEEERNLLSRNNRGRSSTVFTSLRGLLETNSTSPARKSLLGE